MTSSSRQFPQTRAGGKCNQVVFPLTPPPPPPPQPSASNTRSHAKSEPSAIRCPLPRALSHFPRAPSAGRADADGAECATIQETQPESSPSRENRGHRLLLPPERGSPSSPPAEYFAALSSNCSALALSQRESALWMFDSMTIRQTATFQRDGPAFIEDK